MLVFEEPDELPPPIGPVEPTDPVDPRPDNETARFKPSLCTGNDPGSPTCPFNEVALDELGTAGTFRFVLQGVGSGVYFSHVEVTAGPEGLYLEGLTLRFWRSPEGSTAFEHAFDAIVNLEPGESTSLGTAAFANSTFDSMSLRVEAIGPYRP
jgi:hypothetical protein